MNYNFHLNSIKVLFVCTVFPPLSLALFLRLSRLLFVCLRNGNCNGNCDSDVVCVCVCVCVICRAVKFEYCLQCVCRGCLIPPAPCCKLANKLGPSANRSKSSAPSSRVETSRVEAGKLVCAHTLHTNEPVTVAPVCVRVCVCATCV